MWNYLLKFISHAPAPVKRHAGKAVGGALAALIALVGTFEGLRTTAYKDIVGVTTVCYGETRNVMLGDTYTPEECKEMLGERLAEFSKGVRNCLRDPDSLPDKVFISYVSLAYNVGVPTFCRSSIARKANQGDIVGSCNAILLYNRAGGEVVRGLVLRRQKERKICLSGLKG